MSRPKKIDKARQQELSVISENSKEIQEVYMNELDTNPKYSLSVDPLNKYSMSEPQKKFIQYYVEFKNISTAAELAEISMEVAKQFFVAFSTQAEIRRINLALYQRQFCNKMLDLDQIGGYLTSLLTDDNVTIADRLKTSDKLRVAQMLIDLNKFKAESMMDPMTLMTKDIDVEIKSLSVATIRSLIKTQREMNDEKKEIISSVADDMTPEESAYLSTLPTKDLLKLIEDSQSKGDNENE